MRIGVVGDTHDRLENVTAIVELFRRARIERVVHTGDVTRVPVLDRFASLGVPVVGVFGNNDRATRAELAAEAARHGMDLVDPPRILEWSGRRILVTHDPEAIPAPLPGRVDLLLHGHTHRHREERLGETLIFNPGECAGTLRGHNAVGVVDLVPLVARRLHF